jgi:hypothetical protein
MISQEALKQLKIIVNRDYGLPITDDQANELAVSLLRLTRSGISAIAKRNKIKLKFKNNGEDKI